jgi:hypothetical protein
VRYTDVIHVLDRILKLHGFPVQESLLILQSPLACQHPLDTSAEIANSYHHHVHAAQKGSVDGEPEAQLTTPFSTLVAAIAQLSGMGEVTLIRETRQGPIRPDFGVLLTKGHRARFVGWIELKAPGIAVDATSWSGRNAAQWAELSKLDVLLVSNGRIARLYRGGVPHGPDAQLPYDSPQWGTSPNDLLIVLPTCAIGFSGCLTELIEPELRPTRPLPRGERLCTRIVPRGTSQMVYRR